MSKKVNFAMTNQEAVNRVQSASDAIFAHATEQLALSKAYKSANNTVDKYVKEHYDGEIAKLRDAIRLGEEVDAEVIEALKNVQRIEYKRKALSAWYKAEIQSATDYFQLDNIIEELGANNLEDGVSKVDAILKDVFGLEAVATATRKKFARRVFEAMSGQRKASATATTKGNLLSERSRREIKEVGLRAMCEYVAHTANITLKTKEDYTAEFTYEAQLGAVVSYKTIAQ